MTRLLVSVRSVSEAEAALDGGADWIDLKEPINGALGAVDAEVAQQVVARASNRAKVSAAAGELLDWPTSRAKGLLRVAGIGQLKLGLSGCRGREWRRAWLDAQLEIAAAGKSLVAVSYADDETAHSPAPLDMAALAIEARCQWFLVDTFDKRSGTLLECLSDVELSAILQRVRQHSVTTAVAGRLTGAAIAALPLEFVDVVAVRSAACGGDRNGMVCAKQVGALRQLLDAVGTIYPGAVASAPAASGRG